MGQIMQAAAEVHKYIDILIYTPLFRKIIKFASFLVYLCQLFLFHQTSLWFYHSQLGVPNPTMSRNQTGGTELIPMPHPTEAGHLSLPIILYSALH